MSQIKTVKSGQKSDPYVWSRTADGYKGLCTSFGTATVSVEKLNKIMEHLKREK